MPEKIVQCSGCGADIFFVFNKKTRKSHPVEAKPKKVFVNMSVDADNPNWQLREGHESHFAACPYASSFRSRNKNRDRVETTE